MSFTYFIVFLSGSVATIILTRVLSAMVKRMTNRPVFKVTLVSKGTVGTCWRILYWKQNGHWRFMGQHHETEDAEKSITRITNDKFGYPDELMTVYYNSKGEKI